MFTALLLWSSLPEALAQATAWDHGVPKELFKDGETTPKKGKPQPTHRLAPVPANCPECQKIATALQNALDSWYALELAEGEAEKQAGQRGEGPAGAEKAGRAKVAEAMVGLGQPADGGAAAKAKQAKEQTADPKTYGKTPAAAKDALAKKIKDLAAQLQECLKKCPPPQEGGGGPGTAPPPEGEGGGGGRSAPPPACDTKVPDLPKCFASEKERDTYRQNLEALQKKVVECKKKYAEGGANLGPSDPNYKAWQEFKGNVDKAIQDVNKQNFPGDDGKDAIDKVPLCPPAQKSMLPGGPEHGMVPRQPTGEYVLQPGADVAKTEIVLLDTTTQKEIPGGKVVLIPADPKKPIPPPIAVRSDGKVTLPQTEPQDRIVFLPENHEKVELEVSSLPSDSGARLTVPEKPLRLIVHDTSCQGVSDRAVEQGLADQYGARMTAVAGVGWRCFDYRFGTGEFQRADALVEVPHYIPLKPGGGTTTPKDGPTLTDDGKLIEGDQPRDIQGPPPIEPFATSQGSWGQAYPDQWYLKAVRWLRDDGTTVLPASGTPVIVAVIDTGVDFSHSELAEARWVNPDPGPAGDLNGWNLVDNSPDIRDLSGHGTIIAGIIAASSRERFGIAGINPWARIMALKAMELDGHGGSINLAQAIVYASDHAARVINLSVGGRTLTRMEQDAIDYATRRNALVVVASGNEGIETSNFSPAGLKNVLAVAAVGPDLKRQTFSNWGATIGIAAPGVDILSLRARQTDLLQLTRNTYQPGTAVVGEQFYRVTGSSFAAPIVSGAASLLLSVNPMLTAAQVKRMLVQSARDLDGIGTNQFTGYGLLDIAAALAADPNTYAEAAITGVSAVQLRGRTVLRVSGSADADSLKEAHIEIGPGDNPARWTTVAAPITKPVVNGVLGDIPVEAVRGGKQWTLRVIVVDRNGWRREARFKLTLG